MKRYLCCILAALILFSLAGCSGSGNIVGIWEQEMETAILGEGIEEGAAAVSLHRFTFREDGTGLQEHVMLEGGYPDAVREFTWKLEGDTLIQDYGGGHTEEFAVQLSQTTLKLENRRGSYELTKAD